MTWPVCVLTFVALWRPFNAFGSLLESFLALTEPSRNHLGSKILSQHGFHVLQPGSGILRFHNSSSGMLSNRGEVRPQKAANKTS